MKRNLIHILSAIFALGLPFSMFGSQTRFDLEFEENSPLASGKWVRISIDETGLYEITYDELRAMGFEDPSKVALFGTGGYQLNFNLAESDGTPNYSDKMKPVAVMHTGSKLIFYGAGTETMSAAPVGYSSKRYRHRRMEKNVYSDRSYYLLTDTSEPSAPDTNPISDKKNFIEKATGFGYVYHERDLRHNEYAEGQVFWGEELFTDKTETFKIERPYCVDSPAHVWLEFANMYESGGEVECTLEGVKTTSLISNMPCNVYTFGTSSDAVRLTVDENHIGRGTLTFGVSGNYPTGVPLAIDYWTVSYPISLELAKNDPSFASQYIAFTETSSGKWKHPVPENTIVWDITGRRHPKVLDQADGYFYHNVRYATQLIAFRPDREQRHINPDWMLLDNQNLHALQNEPIAMVIITLPRFKEQAEKIAALHEQYLGEKVSVVTPQEVYDEFNYGTPDITALRAFVKMIYHRQPETLKNVLVFGPVHADYRNVGGHPDREEVMPIYMIPKINLKRAESAEGSASPDYLGVMSDYINTNGMLSNASLELGVGILPVTTIEEADLSVKKIREFLAKTDFSNLVNEYMTIADTGDSHIHDFQAFQLANQYRDYSLGLFGSEYAVSPLWSEGMGYKKTKDEIKNALKRGKLLSTYYGHATATGFMNLTYQDLMGLDNNEPSFFFIAACDLCEPDRNHHGVGDLGVIRNSKGLVGVVCATRSVLSHENQNLSENFVNSLFYDLSGNVRKDSPSFGEVYAHAKSKTSNVSKQAYILVGDPGLPVPIALGRMNVTTDRTEYRGGEVMEVKGELLDSDGGFDSSYNGFATVKLMQPASTKAIVADPIDENGVVRPNPRLVINDYRVATVKAEVKNGRFKARLQLPKSVDNYLSTPDSTRTMSVLVGAYNPQSRLASSGKCSLIMPLRNSIPSENAIKDNKAPDVKATHDEVLRRLTVTATDDTGLIPGIGSGKSVILTIDGVEYNVSSSESEGITTSVFSIPVSTATLAKGQHTARMRASDVAGNTSAEVTYKFEITDTPKLVLSAESDIVIDELTLHTDRVNEVPLTLLVSASDGKVVHTDAFESRSLTIDLSDLPQGVYRVAVREDSPRGSKVCSNWLDITKID